jgi:adenylylsulfate kinase
MKILIFGLPGSGKTWLSERLQKYLSCAWYNADAVRKMANDWDFSVEGRRRQAERMNTIATFEGTHGRTVICDFVCPTEDTRKQFDPDITIWMDTIESGRFEDTNKMFERPMKVDYIIDEFFTDQRIEDFAWDLKIEHGI